MIIAQIVLADCLVIHYIHYIDIKNHKEKIMRKLIYTNTKQLVKVGDQHRILGWKVEIASMNDVGTEVFGSESVKISHMQGASYSCGIFASNIGAEWV